MCVLALVLCVSSAHDELMARFMGCNSWVGTGIIFEDSG
jgi:hypothetical protein